MYGVTFEEVVGTFEGKAVERVPDIGDCFRVAVVAA